MPDFYYQIKGRASVETEHWGPWAWPPIFSGLVTATDKKEAKKLIDEEYGRNFPQRVLKTDLQEHSYLLHIKPLEGEGDYILKRFIKTSCIECGATFKIIDKFNDPYVRDKSFEHCSDNCAEEGRLRARANFNATAQGKSPPVIYRIRQLSTKKAYVGQTTQPFTLRWWQHLSTPTDCKFHEAMKNSRITDWDFKVIEVIQPPEGCDIVAYINERERFWIQELDAVDSGFNTVRPAGMPARKDLVESACEALLEGFELSKTT